MNDLPTQEDKTLISNSFDCVVMLTWSNWHTEMRSNRYNYAVRFAQHLPVIFVQADLSKARFFYEPTEVDGLTILHIFKRYGTRQTKMLNEALLEKQLITPLFWIYNPLFSDFIFTSYSPLRIYHATEDYFKSKSNLIELDHHTKKALITVVESSDILVSVSEEVEKSYLKNCDFTGHTILLLNGCDFTFWNNASCSEKRRVNTANKVVLYQGGISAKIDFEMLRSIILTMNDWEFWFCGEISQPIKPLWNSIEKLKNVRYFGKIHPTEVRELAYEAGVAIIPFIQDEIIVKSSLPLKAFEYLATGLPVVTVPIESLLPYSKVFSFATTPDEFVEKIHISINKTSQDNIQERYEIAKAQDYNKKFKILISNINYFLDHKKNCELPRKILVLCSQKLIESDLIPFSKTNYIFYDCPEQSNICYLLMHDYDILVIDYLLICDNFEHLHISYQEEILSSGKYKIMLIWNKEEIPSYLVFQKLGIHKILCKVVNQNDELYEYISVNTIQEKIPLDEIIRDIDLCTYPKSQVFRYQPPFFLIPTFSNEKHEELFLKYLYFIILFVSNFCSKLKFLNYFSLVKIILQKIFKKVTLSRINHLIRNFMLKSVK